MDYKQRITSQDLIIAHQTRMMEYQRQTNAQLLSLLSPRLPWPGGSKPMRSSQSQYHSSTYPPAYVDPSTTNPGLTSIPSPPNHAKVPASQNPHGTHEILPGQSDINVISTQDVLPQTSSSQIVHAPTVALLVPPCGNNAMFSSPLQPSPQVEPGQQSQPLDPRINVNDDVWSALPPPALARNHGANLVPRPAPSERNQQGTLSTISRMFWMSSSSPS